MQAFKRIPTRSNRSKSWERNEEVPGRRVAVRKRAPANSAIVALLLPPTYPTYPIFFAPVDLPHSDLAVHRVEHHRRCHYSYLLRLPVFQAPTPGPTPKASAAAAKKEKPRPKSSEMSEADRKNALMERSKKRLSSKKMKKKLKSFKK